GEPFQVRSLCRHPERIGYCLATCHAFASGLWNGSNWGELEEKGRQLGYWADLAVIHLNDSRYPSGSHKDFHANIGRGRIGDEAFRLMLRSPVVQGIPLILETPHDPQFAVEAEIRHVKELIQ